MPQALLFMVFIMMFMVLALNIVLFTITPQYIQYGNQKYVLKNGTQVVEVKSCTTNAPPSTLNERLVLFRNLADFLAVKFMLLFFSEIFF